jgi:transposase-like protein
MAQKPEPTPADVFEHVGRALCPGDDRQARLARELGVRREAVRQWMHGHLPLRPDHFETLSRLLVERQAEMKNVEVELGQWLSRQPKD